MSTGRGGDRAQRNDERRYLNGEITRRELGRRSAARGYDITGITKRQIRANQ